MHGRVAQPSPKSAASPNRKARPRSAVVAARGLGNRAVAVGHRGDPFEREAEQLAPQISRGEPVAVTESTSNATAQAAGGPAGGRAIAATAIPQSHGGSLLPSRLREEFGSALNADLSGVRLHTDLSAARLNASLHSRAVTFGGDIYFGSGQFNPHSSTGRELIAHEAVHTVQQDFGRNPQAMMLQCEMTKEETIEALSIIEQKTTDPLEDLQGNQEVRDNLPAFLEKQLNTKVDTIKKYVLEYEQDYNKDIADLVEKSKTVKIDPSIQTIVTDGLREIDSAKKRVSDAIAAGGNADFLKLQLEYLDAARSHLGNPAMAKAASAVHQKTGGVIRGDELSFIQSLPLTDDNDDMRVAIVSAIGSHQSLAGNVAAEVRNLHQPVISLWFWKDMLLNPKTPEQRLEETTEQTEEAAQQLEEETGETPDTETQESIAELTEEERALLLEFAQEDDNAQDDPKKLLEKFKNLTELEKKILEANKLLNQRSETSNAGDIQLSMSDIQGVQGGGSEAEKDIEKQLSQAEKVLDILSSKKKDSSTVIDFSLIRDAMKALQTELTMFRGLLKGAARRYPELGTFETDLEESIKNFFEAIQESMAKDLAIDILISLIPVVGGPAAIVRKIEKIVKLIQTIQRVLSIIDTVKNVVDIVSKAQGQIGVIESKLKQLDQFSAEEDFEELVFQLIDDYNLLDYLVLPEFDTLSEEDIQNEVLKIVRDIPKGLTAFKDMYNTYESMPSDPDKDQLANLAISSIMAGALLSPVVAFLAMTALAKIASGIASMDKTIFDRINPLNRKHRGKHKSLKDKQDASKKKLEKARRKGYDYEAKPIKDLIERDYKPALEAEINNADNSLGGHAWSEGFFKHFVEEEVKVLNQSRGKKRVKAKLKKKKKTDPDVIADAPMLALKGPKIDFKKSPWRVTLRTKIVNTDVEVKPNATFHEISYKDFAGTGIAYETKQMAGKYKPRKRREIDKWLKGKNRYQFTYASDPATGEEVRTEANKFIRMPGGNKLPGHLKIDAGFIKQGSDPNSYQRFLGKRLSGGVMSRVNVDSVSKLLPPEYYARRQSAAIQIVSKPDSGATESLVWDNGLLAKGNKNRSPRVIDARKLDESADVTYDSLSTTQVDQMVDNMFVKDASGVVKKPEKVDATFKAQNKDQRKHWKDYIGKKPELKKRPKTIDTNLGYTVNANRGSLSSKHLPELKTTDDKGHLVAARFNGPDSLNNLVPMNTALNQGGEWYEMEHTMAQAYVGAGYKTGDFVNLKITLNYGTLVRRPDSFDVKWEHKRGATVLKSENKTGIQNP